MYIAEQIWGTLSLFKYLGLMDVPRFSGLSDVLFPISNLFKYLNRISEERYIEFLIVMPGGGEKSTQAADIGKAAAIAATIEK